MKKERGITMNEILYKSSATVAALNRVEGFEPLSLARIIQKDGQEDQLYLDVKYRKLWFRLCNPNGRIAKKIISIQENMAIVEARIYLDKNDPESSFVASALAQKFRSGDPEFGDKFLELAETAAVGRALSDAGYGIQFADADVQEKNDPNQVDAGIPAKAPQNAAYPQGGNMAYPTQPQIPNGYVLPQGAQPMMGQTMPMPQAPRAQAVRTQASPAGQGIPNQPTLDPRRPVQELLAGLSYEQARAVVIDGNGIHAGKTMGQVAMEKPDTLNWYVNKYGGPNNLLRAAAQVLLTKAAA